MGHSTGAISLGRLIAVLLPIALAAFGGSYLVSAGYQQAAAKAQQDMESNMLARLLGPTSPGPENPIKFVDTDGDLIADSPAADACRKPEKIAFSYVATAYAGDMPKIWQEVVDALSNELGLPVEYSHYSTTREQLAAMAGGELHIAGFNTGATPIAVRTRRLCAGLYVRSRGRRLWLQNAYSLPRRQRHQRGQPISMAIR